MAKTNYGGNLTQIFTLSSVWQPTTEIIGLENNFTTAISGHEKTADLAATITHERFDSTVTSFFDSYLSEASATTDEKYENNQSASASGVAPGVGGAFLAITYSGKSTETTPKRYVKFFPAKLSGGGFTMEADSTIRPETTLTAVKIPTVAADGTTAIASISIPATLFATSKVSSATTQTINAGLYGGAAWFTAV